jgi:hypothetical protein
MSKRAFTLLELIIIIIIISILSFSVIQKTDNRGLYYAANQVLFHIRYTQHLALIDNVFDPNDPDWFKKRWQIQFHSTVSGYNLTWTYSVYKDTSLSGNENSKKELAKNPMNRDKLLSGGFYSYTADDEDFTKSMVLGNSFGIKDILFEGECGKYRSKRLAFNYDGAPYYGNLLNVDDQYEKRMTEVCKIHICLEDCETTDKKVIIAVEPETGFAHILN